MTSIFFSNVYGLQKKSEVDELVLTKALWSIFCARVFEIIVKKLSWES
ncbi:MAG: hypothetical protein IPH28_20495 [Cytophagaceae bacterium]|nr:hypothetical protein [Cytophagaceae bacterium]